MTIEEWPRTGVHVVAFWFVAGVERDWLACLMSRGKEHRLRYRFRYHHDKSPWFDSDESWWTAQWVGEVDLPEQASDQVAALTASQYGSASTYQKVIVDGDMKKAFQILSEQPFAH